MDLRDDCRWYGGDCGDGRYCDECLRVTKAEEEKFNTERKDEMRDFEDADTNPGTAYELGRKDERGYQAREMDRLVRDVLISWRKAGDKESYEELKAILTKHGLLKGGLDEPFDSCKR